jgi:hypothetical protein
MCHSPKSNYNFIHYFSPNSIIGCEHTSWKKMSDTVLHTQIKFYKIPLKNKKNQFAALKNTN